MPIATTEIEIIPSNDSVVTVTLRKIQHQAQRGDEVDDDFLISLAVNGAGENHLLYHEVGAIIGAGTSKTITGTSNTFNYDSTSCAGLLQKDLIFIAIAAGANGGADMFMGNAKGKLKAGRLNFNIPLVLEANNKKSTILLRGTIHVSCPNG